MSKGIDTAARLIAAHRWAYYAAEGNAAKTDALTVLIAAAKAEIRAKYPDNAGGT